jgi:hypothetical protein
MTMFTPGLIMLPLMMIAPMCTSIGPTAGGTNDSAGQDQDGSWNAGSGTVPVDVDVDVDVAAAAPATGAPTASTLTADATAARRCGMERMGFSSFR